MQTWVALERDEDQPDLGSLLPDWFECEATEYRDLLKKRTSFSRLKERTQLAIVYVYFFFRFQRDTPRSALDNFFYSAQEPSEGVEEWGYRLERLATKVLAYGQSITFDEYLDQWATGTRDTFFVAKLEEALQSDDPGKSPVIFDYSSFRAWYSRYVTKLIDRRKQIARRSRLMSMNKLRQSRRKSDGKSILSSSKSAIKEKATSGKTPKQVQETAGGQKGFKTNTSDLHRRGPAPPVTRNQHSNLFRPGPNDFRHKRCFNCDKVGHVAKDCPDPKRPRRQKPR